jgi:hypothetical protein
VVQINFFMPWWKIRYPMGTFLVNEENIDWLTGPHIDAYVRSGIATVCAAYDYELGIPIGGLGEMAGQESVIKVIVGGLEGRACLGNCPCEGGWTQPMVSVVVDGLESPRKPRIYISAFDLDGDIICAGYYALYGSLVERGTSLEGPRFEAFGLFRTCTYEVVYNPPVECDRIKDPVIGWAKDAKGLQGSSAVILDIPDNRPPQVRGELQGEATVTLYPDRVQVSPVVLRGEVFDPDGDPVFVEAPASHSSSQATSPPSWAPLFPCTSRTPRARRRAEQCGKRT